MEVQKIPISKLVVDKNNPRSEMGDIEGLAGSLKEHGQHEPISVEELGNGKYLINNGHRRYNAALKIEKDTKVPQTLQCIVHKTLSEKDRLIKQAQIDSQTKTLSMKERDALWAKLYKVGNYSVPEFAKLMGVSTTVISDFLDREQLPAHIKKMELSPSLLKETRLLDKDTRGKIIKHAHEKDIGSRQMRVIVKEIKDAPQKVVNAYLNNRLDLEDIKKLKALPEDRQQIGIEAIGRMKKAIKSVPKQLDKSKVEIKYGKKTLTASQFVRRMQEEITKTSLQISALDSVLDKIESDKLDQHFDERMKQTLAKYLNEMHITIVPVMGKIEKAIGKWR